MQVKNRLKYLRTKAGLTVTQLANKTGISSSMVSRQENLERTIPTEAAIAYCDFFGCSMDYFFYREDHSDVFEKFSALELKEVMKIVEEELKKRKAE